METKQLVKDAENLANQVKLLLVQLEGTQAGHGTQVIEVRDAIFKLEQTLKK